MLTNSQNQQKIGKHPKTYHNTVYTDNNPDEKKPHARKGRKQACLTHVQVA